MAFTYGDLIKASEVVAAIDEKATYSYQTVNVPANGWVSTSEYAYQTVSATGILASDNPFIDLYLSTSDGVAVKQSKVIEWCKVYQATTAENSITLYATSAPSADLIIKVGVVR